MYDLCFFFYKFQISSLLRTSLFLLLLLLLLCLSLFVIFFAFLWWIFLRWFLCSYCFFGAHNLLVYRYFSHLVCIVRYISLDHLFLSYSRNLLPLSLSPQISMCVYAAINIIIVRHGYFKSLHFLLLLARTCHTKPMLKLNNK